jgi:hypothetical protein
MPRRHRRPTGPAVAASEAPVWAETRVRWRGDEYLVRMVSGSDKVYRCPGCDQQIGARLPHVVAWPEHDADAEDRRHWHTPCWGARDRRVPRVQRSRSAPRY